jgi:stage III sporulation protein AG
MEWFKNIVTQFRAKGGQNLTNVAIVLIIGVIIMIAGSALFDNESTKKTSPVQPEHENVQSVIKNKNNNDEYGKELEEKLESILSKIEGVGDVSVMITFDSSNEIVLAEDKKNNETITEEEDTQGGKRKITQFEKDYKILVLSEQGGRQEPMVLKEMNPKVKGVIVAAEGAEDTHIKANVFDAVKTVLGVPAYKVQVFQLKN